MFNWFLYTSLTSFFYSLVTKWKKKILEKLFVAFQKILGRILLLGYWLHITVAKSPKYFINLLFDILKLVFYNHVVVLTLFEKNS